jgi:di/tricarboxylate transporter
LVQAVVARGSPLVGQTVAEARFRSEYGGAVIAIQRGSERVHEHPGKVKLQTGDALLIQAGPSFLKQNQNDYKTFALVSEVENSSPPRPRLFLLCVVLIVASLVVAGLEIRSLLITASIVGIVMVSVGVVTQQEARDCLQWDLYIVVSCAFGIGTAMENSGVATGLATFLVDVGTSIGLGGVYTCLLKSSVIKCSASLSNSPLL